MDTDSRADDGSRTRLRFGPSTAETIYRWLHRVVAFYCLVFGILYWVRLIGFYEGAEWRFDLMPVHWQVASVVLATLFPFAASGLWMLASWGPVIWFLCAVIETAMYVGMPELFGDRPLIVVSHAMAALIYIALRILLHLRPEEEVD